MVNAHIQLERPPIVQKVLEWHPHCNPACAYHTKRYDEEQHRLQYAINSRLRPRSRKDSQYDTNQRHPNAPPERIETLVVQYHQLLVALFSLELTVALYLRTGSLQEAFCDLFTWEFNCHLVFIGLFEDSR